jgi:hypothetical protein
MAAPDAAARTRDQDPTTCLIGHLSSPRHAPCAFAELPHRTIMDDKHAVNLTTAAIEVVFRPFAIYDGLIRMRPIGPGKPWDR